MPLNGTETNTPITPYISNSPPPPNDLEEEEENEENAVQNKHLNLSNLSGESENFSIKPMDNQMSKEEEESEKNEEENDEDEWADFVDSTTADLSDIKQEEPTKKPTFNSSASQLDSPTLKTNIDLLSPIKLVEPFKFEQLDSNQLLNRIFGSLCDDVQKRFPVSTSNVDVNLLNMKNDASASLKFKWTKSELETNFLNSIQVERVSVLNNAQHI